MSAKNKKMKERRWVGLRGAVRYLGEKLRSSFVALGLQGAFVAALLVAAAVGVQLARREAAGMSRFRVCPAHFRAEGPKWAEADLNRVSFPKEAYSIFDPDLARDVAQAYLTSAWVKAVRRVEKRFPNEIRVELDLREPAAFVRFPNACHAVDDEGVRLPLDYTQWDHLQHPLPLIFGVKSDPPRPGQRWADAGVAAALSVLGSLAAEPTILREIHFVDVSNLDGAIDPQRSEVLLYSRRHVRIEWGRPPNTAKFGEPTVGQKLARLRQCLARPLALAGGGSHVDLRFPDDPALARQ